MASGTSPTSGNAPYEVIPVTSGSPTTILRRDGTNPEFLVGFMNLASSNQTVSGVLADLTANPNIPLPQIGQLAATQSVQLVTPGFKLFNGLVVTLTGAPIAPGIGILVR